MVRVRHIQHDVLLRRLAISQSENAHKHGLPGLIQALVRLDEKAGLHPAPDDLHRPSWLRTLHLVFPDEGVGLVVFPVRRKRPAFKVHRRLHGEVVRTRDRSCRYNDGIERGFVRSDESGNLDRFQLQIQRRLDGCQDRTDKCFA